ncbi:MAG: serine/threonine protein kinase, partial [Blastocatellia bacterium]|nr:serine/threonine protein kinase [Blastocatellia bacterium]
IDEEKRIDITRVIEIGKQICDAISSAHQAGVIHRDLKPDNVMIETINNRETVRVLDFGIAKLKDTQQSITKTGNVVGTPHYMSPEQCNGGTVDHRTDIYSVGVMIYEMLSGQVPFTGPTPVSIVVQHVTKDATPLHELSVDIPEPLSHVIMRSLEKEPTRRQQSASEFAEQLTAAVEYNEVSVGSSRLLSKTTPSWRAVFTGALDPSDEGIKRLADGLKKKMGFSQEKVLELLKCAPAIVKQSNSKQEVNEVAEKLRSVGADVKVESEESSARATIPMSSFRQSSRETVEADPLLVTDGTEMMSYVTEQVKKTSPLKNITSPLNNPENKSTKELTSSDSPSSLKTEKMEIPTPSLVTWTIDINGLLYENLTDEDVESWIRAGRLRVRHKIKRGNGVWREIGSVSQFRAIFQQISPHVFETELQSSQEQETRSTSFFVKMVKMGLVVLVVFVLISFGQQYWQRKLLEDELKIVLTSKKTKVSEIPNLVKAALLHRDLKIPAEDIHIIANPSDKKMIVRIDYKRSLIGIPLQYQAKYEALNIEMPISELSEIPETEIEIVGSAVQEVTKYRRQKALKKAEEKIAGYQGEPETLRERQETLEFIKECEEGLRAFDITSVDEEGRKVFPKFVKIRDKEYSRESLETYLSNLKQKLVDVERQLADQRTKKLESEVK